MLREKIFNLIEDRMGLALFIENLAKCRDMLEGKHDRGYFYLSSAVDFFALGKDMTNELKQTAADFKDVLIDANELYKELRADGTIKCESLKILVEVNEIALSTVSNLRVVR